MSLNPFSLAAAAAVALGSVASADVTFNLPSFQSGGTPGVFVAGATQAYGVITLGTLMGTLQGITVNLTLIDSGGTTFANSFAVLVDNDNGSDGQPPLVRAGGQWNVGSPQQYSWTGGNSNVDGTSFTSTIMLDTPLNNAITPISVGVGNFAQPVQGSFGVWQGTVTLIGVDNVPAPGAVALLGMAGLFGRRRRS
jgi:MYXO-CTERM domain-containing protein